MSTYISTLIQRRIRRWRVHRLAEFFRRCAVESWRGLSVDGADIQEWAVELGLMVEVRYDPVIHGRSGFEYELEIGDPWFVLSKDVLDILNTINKEANKDQN